jgi:hypothetical protein
MKRPLSLTRAAVVAGPVAIHNENFSSSGSSTTTDNGPMADDSTMRSSYLLVRPPLKRMKCSTLSDMNENSSIEFDVRTFTTDQSMDMEDGEPASMNMVFAFTSSQDVSEGILEQVAQAAALSHYFEPNAAIEATATHPATSIVSAQRQQPSLPDNATSMQHKRKLRYCGSSTISSCSLAVSQTSIRTERSASNDEYDPFDIESGPSEPSESIHTTAMNEDDPVLIESLVLDWSHNFVLQVPKQQRTKSQVQAARRTIHRTHFLSKKQSSLSL